MTDRNNQYRLAESFHSLQNGWWDWCLWIEADKKDLDRIDHVVYTLPPVANPERTEKNRKKRFEVRERILTGFKVYVTIMLKDEAEISLEHDIVLPSHEQNRSATAQSADENSFSKIRGITIRGERQRVLVDDSDDFIHLKESFVIGGATRGFVEKNEITVEENNLIEFVFEDDTSWLCSPDTIDEVFPQAASTRTAGSTFEVPLTLQSDSEERGIATTVALKMLNIFTKKAVGKEVRKLAADLERQQLDNQSGLYRVDAQFTLRKYVPEQTAKPYLLFLHGTASSTKGSFSELAGTELWSFIQQTYGSNVLAFQHETLTKSPLENVLNLVDELPQNAMLHIISHSRGGLVGDILARFCNSDQNARGFDQKELNYFEKADRPDEIQAIFSLKGKFENRNITVKKFIRVACPASGTILASKRLDNFFNITANLIGLGTGIGASPIYITLKNLIATILDSKSDASVLPGLEAMNPNSPFIKVLNSPATSVVVDDPLIVISGNCKTQFNLKALLIIASKLFYARDNDLVVNTRSMYQGTRRAEPVQYFFDEAGNVDHFHYFKNKQTNEAIMRALQAVDGNAIPGFSKAQQITLAEAERNAILKPEGGQVFTSRVTGTKPIVLLLPGIMGSNLTQNGRLVWINYLKFIGGELTSLDMSANGISAPSLVRTSYKKLVDYLSGSYDVVTFPFDWRKPLNETADDLNNKIVDLLKHRQPIKLIGHSMGGVLIRDFIIQYNETWKVLNQSFGFRLLFLGAPLGGSFRIPYVLFGKDVIIDKLSKIDIFHTKEELLDVFSQFPGLLNLLPLNKEAENDFARLRTWEAMREAFGNKDWPLPAAGLLQKFEAYRNAVHETMNTIDFSNAVYIAGQDRATPSGYRIDTNGTARELVFLSTAEGDQSVTWESGIPKRMINDGTVYYVNVTHGALANDSRIFPGIAEILENGYTNLLNKTRPAIRSAEKLFRTPEQEDFDITPDGVEKTILSLGTEEPLSVTEAPIQVSVSHGDLRYASYPVLAGHFKGDGILYAEKAIDWNLKGALTERHRLALYPGDIGTSEVLVGKESDFAGAIIVGLGKFGSLTAFQLTLTVEQGIAKYLLNVNDKIARNDSLKSAGIIGISPLIIGCGYGGLSVESSVRAIVQGVQNANEKIKALLGNAKTVQVVEFIELYEDVALSCFYTLSKIEKEENRPLKIGTGNKKIKTLFGSRRRLPADAAEGWWNRINVKQIKEAEFSGGVRCLLFSASTGGAREEQRELYSSTALTEQLIEEISGNNNWSAARAKTIFELLIPNDFKEQLKRQGNINWILDKSTAAYPWELLQDSVTDAKPLCVNAGMIRQLGTQDYRLNINAVTNYNALVIGDPDLKGFINQLPGAYKEAEMVYNLLKTNGFVATRLLKESPPEIVQALFRDDYKIIHLAGHGVFDEDNPHSSGMVIGDNVFLSTREISQMSTVPELVFVNCCYLGKTDSTPEALYRSRYKLAANIGTQLIENGVTAVIAAGWAVDDSAALEFTRVFYESMFDGYTFGDAVQEARKTIYGKYKNNNTWGAYQCYGDPFYKFRSNEKSKKAVQYSFVIAQQAETELNNLYNRLDTGDEQQDKYLEQLAAISKAVDKAGLRTAAITEREAFIYTDLYEYDFAIARFESLLSMEKASFSVATLEKYCNLRAKKVVMDAMQERKDQQELIADIDKVIADLKSLLLLSPTAERYSLLGSAHKRKAKLYTGEQLKEKADAYTNAAFYYLKADAIRSTAYTLTNLFELVSILVLSGNLKWKGTIGSTAECEVLPSAEGALHRLEKIGYALSVSAEQMDYWQMIEFANVKLCRLLVNPSMADDQKAFDEVLQAYRSVWNKAGTKGKKIAEIEHFELLLDGMSLISGKKANLIRKTIEQVKAELEKML